MKTGDELGKSVVLVTLAVMLFPITAESVRQGLTVKEFERGLRGGLLCTGNRVLDQLLVAQGQCDLGKTVAHPDDRRDGETIESRTSTHTAKHFRQPDTACSSSLAQTLIATRIL